MQRRTFKTSFTIEIEKTKRHVKIFGLWNHGDIHKNQKLTIRFYLVIRSKPVSLNEISLQTISYSALSVWYFNYYRWNANESLFLSAFLVFKLSANFSFIAHNLVPKNVYIKFANKTSFCTPLWNTNLTSFLCQP